MFDGLFLIWQDVFCAVMFLPVLIGPGGFCPMQWSYVLSTGHCRAATLFADDGPFYVASVEMRKLKFQHYLMRECRHVDCSINQNIEQLMQRHENIKKVPLSGAPGTQALV